MVVEVSSGSLIPLGLELWGVQAAVSCCTCQQEDFAFRNLDNTSWWSKQASHLALGRANGGDKGEGLELQLH